MYFLFLKNLNNHLIKFIFLNILIVRLFIFCHLNVF